MHTGNPLQTPGRDGTRKTPLRRWLVVIPVALLLVAGSLLYLGLSQDKTASVPLGASAAVTGGLARINGILPLEASEWEEIGGSQDTSPVPAEGAHQVRILLELTALDPGGVDFTASDYFIVGAGTDRFEPVWTPIPAASLAQGETFTAALVFELPDRAILLTLEGDNGVQLSLGTDHHSGAL